MIPEHVTQSYYSKSEGFYILGNIEKEEPGKEREPVMQGAEALPEMRFPGLTRWYHKPGRGGFQERAGRVLQQ